MDYNLISNLVLIIIGLMISNFATLYLLNDRDSQVETSERLKTSIARQSYREGWLSGVQQQIIEYGSQEFDLSEEPDILDGIDFSLINKLNKEG